MNPPPGSWAPLACGGSFFHLRCLEGTARQAGGKGPLRAAGSQLCAEAGSRASERTGDAAGRGECVSSRVCMCQ